MSRIRRLIPQFVLKTIYNSLILSHLCYGILIWGWDSARLLKLQKKAVRLIVNAKYNAHTDPIFRKLDMLKMKDIYMWSCAKFYYKFKKCSLPHYFKNFFTRNMELHDYNTRNRFALRPIQYRFHASNNCIRYRIPVLINNLPDHIKHKINTHSLLGFALHVKYHFIKNYDIVCHVEHCYICNRV